MSISKLITVLILTTSSAALAKPIEVRDHRDDRFMMHAQDNLTQAPYQDYRHDNGYHQGWVRRPITLANDVQITSDFRDHRGQRPLFIDVNDRLGGFSRLRFDTQSGRTFIDTIVVMLPNGQSRTYSVKQMLSFRSPSITVDLDQRAITGIYVYGSALRSRGSFDVVGLRR